MIRPVFPDYPVSALGTPPTRVIVALRVDAQGKAVKATITKSSGNPAIDRSALTAARLSEYSPKIVNCVPVEGDYIYRANFDPNP